MLLIAPPYHRISRRAVISVIVKRGINVRVVYPLSVMLVITAPLILPFVLNVTTGRIPTGQLQQHVRLGRAALGQHRRGVVLVSPAQRVNSWSQVSLLV